MKSGILFLCILLAAVFCIIAVVTVGCVSTPQNTANAYTQLSDEEKAFFEDQILPNVTSALTEQMVAAPVSYVEVNGARLAYREFGTSNEKPLILIMGYTGVMDRWDGAFVYSLAEEYHVYIYDHRGMGYSTDNGTQYELRQLADDCVALMGALGHDTFYVAGHSMGSIITQILVAEYPGHIEKAVIISTIPTINYPGAEVIKGKIVFAADNKDLVGDGIYRESLALISYTGVYDQLKNVTTDVLVVVGTADEVTPQQGSADVAGEIDGAWLVRFKECSHRIWAEVPLRVSGTIKYYLAMDETYSP